MKMNNKKVFSLNMKGNLVDPSSSFASSSGAGMISQGSGDVVTSGRSDATMHFPNAYHAVNGSGL